MGEEDVGAAIQRSLRWQARFLLLVAAGVVALFAYDLWYASRISHTLCTFRGDLVQRAEQGRVYLRDTPTAKLLLPRAQIQTQINNQQRTIDSLHGLNCDTSTEGGHP